MAFHFPTAFLVRPSPDDAMRIRVFMPGLNHRRFSPSPQALNLLFYPNCPIREVENRKPHAAGYWW